MYLLVLALGVTYWVTCHFPLQSLCLSGSGQTPSVTFRC